MESHRRYQVRVPLNGIAQRFPAGHRLRVSLSTSYWPLAWLPPEPVLMNIHTGNSKLWLPVRAPRDEDETLRPFAEPEQAPSIETTRLELSEHNSLLHRDLANKESTLEVINDQGGYRIDEIGTEIRRSTRERYSFKKEDFTSARGETYTQRAFTRDDWNIEVITRTMLTCTTKDFLIHAQLDAYEDDRRVYSQNWDRVIARDNV